MTTGIGAARSRRIITLAVLAALAVFPALGLNQYIYRIAVMCGLYIILGMSLNLIAGVAGQITLGHVAFYGIGAYTSAILTVNLGFPVWIGMIAAFVVAGIAGLLIGFPSLKLSGGYLAIITLGFAEIIRLILLNWFSLTRGPMGILNIPKPVFFGRKLGQGNEFYWLVFISAVAVYVAMNNLIHSKFGRNLRAIRDDVLSSEAMGIDVYRHKVIAFSIAAAIAGLAGSMYAHFMEFIDPSSFISEESTVILSIVVLGGMGSMNGTILAASLLTILPEALRFFSAYRLLAYGAVLLLMMLLKVMNFESIVRSLRATATFERNR